MDKREHEETSVLGNGFVEGCSQTLCDSNDEEASLYGWMEITERATSQDHESFLRAFSSTASTGSSMS